MTDGYDIKIIRLDETTSTSDCLRSCATPRARELTVVTARYQTAGRGQGSNRWESEDGKNLLFSVLASPVTVDITRQFVLSMAGALAVKAALDEYTDGITLKWPNDIYWNDSKISGTLIETCVAGRTITRCIYGIGINVNQRVFRSDAPNPVSLCNITGKTTDTDRLLDSVLRHFVHCYDMVAGGHADVVMAMYHKALYRRDGMHAYLDVATGERFMARIDHVGADGLLHLVTVDGLCRTYELKQVRFVL